MSVQTARMSSQNPRPQASTTCPRLDAVQKIAASTTMTVPSSAKMKASGTQRSVHAVRRSAVRASTLLESGAVCGRERVAVSINW